MGPGTPGCGHLQCPHYGPKPPCAPSPQIDQLRAELLQERSSRQDLECDKVSLERQVSEGPHPAHSPAGPGDPRAAASASLPLSSTSPVFARGCPTSAAKCPLPGWMQPLPLPPRAPASGRASSELSLCRSTRLLPRMLQGSAAEWGPPGAPAGSPLPSRPGATASGSPPAPPGSEPFITQRGAGWEQSGSMGNELLEPCSFPGCHYRCQNQHGARAAGTAQQLGRSWPTAGSAPRGEEPRYTALLG